MKLRRNHFIAIFIVVTVVLGLAAIFAYSCGQSPSSVETATTTSTTSSVTATTTVSATTVSATTTSTTTTTIVATGATVSGVVMVPASSVASAFRLSSIRAAATADDGVSDTPLGGATVTVCDPVTGQQIANTPTATTDSTGTFTIDASNIPSGKYIYKATKNVGASTVMVETLAATNEVIAINAGETLATSKLLSEMYSKAANLFENASSLPTAEKESLRRQMESMFSGIRESIGTISSAPNLAISGISGSSSPAEIQNRLNQALSGKLAEEFIPPSNWTTQIGSFYDTTTSLVSSGRYPSGLRVPTDAFPRFTPPSGMNFPSGTTFDQPVNEAGFASFAGSYFSGIKNAIQRISGAQFYCPLPDLLAGQLPSGAVFGNASFVGSGWSGSGKLPPSAVFSGIPPSALPSGIYVPPGADFAGISSDQKILPSGIYMDSGFIVPTDLRFASGYELPIYASFSTSYVMPSNVNFPPSYAMPSNVSFTSGFIMPNDVDFQSGFYMPSGIQYESGFIMPKEVSFQSGYYMPSGIQLESGFTMPKDVLFYSGYVPPSGINYESGWQRPSGWIPPPTGWQDPAPAPSGQQPPPSGQSTTTTFPFTPPSSQTTTTFPFTPPTTFPQQPPPTAPPIM